MFHVFCVQVQELRSENESLREEVGVVREELHEAREETRCVRERTCSVHRCLVRELEYLSAPCSSAELLASQCVKTQLTSCPIVLRTAGSPATFRMTSYSSHRESGQVSKPGGL